MTYAHFIQVLLAHKKFWEDISDLYDIGLNVMDGKFDLTRPVNLMMDSAIKSHYGDEGWEWVEWFIYESDYGQKDFSSTPTYQHNEDGTASLVESSMYGARDENGNPICYSYESLWEYIEANHKVK